MEIISEYILLYVNNYYPEKIKRDCENDVINRVFQSEQGKNNRYFAPNRVRLIISGFNGIRRFLFSRRNTQSARLLETLGARLFDRVRAGNVASRVVPTRD